jgi:hypothetical protein
MTKEMEVRTEIAEQTIFRAKLINVKRAKLKSMMLEMSQYKQITQDLKECTDDEIILQNRK